MKRVIYSTTAALALALAATSCKSEFTENDTCIVPQGDAVISATFEQPQDDTRTHLNSDCKVLWDNGDEFALLSETGKSRFSLISGAGTGSAEFSGTLSGAAPYYALFPYSDDAAIVDGKLRFTLPQEQTATVSTFGYDASPALATMSDAGVPAQFRNLCGVLEVNLSGSSMKIQKIAVCDLAGTPLWGDCELLLDGKQGTDEQTMTVTGGSNEIILNLEKETSLLSNTARSLCVVVPAGSFSKGFAVKVFDKSGQAVSFISTQNPAAKISRSFISTMKRVKINTDAAEPVDTLARGYFKDLFMDGGVNLTSRKELYAMSYIGWNYDLMATSDSTFQHGIVVGNDEDLNGVLLYPDNEPRYRMIYVNGGSAGAHGKSLTSQGRDNYRTFVNNGGSYLGSCAGAFIAAKGTETGNWTNYLGLYPGYAHNTGVHGDSTGMFVPKDSPLLQYYDFGGDFYVKDVYHNGGCYAPISSVPAKTEGLMLYDNPGKAMHNNYSVWAYKENNVKGRVICCGSHPEREPGGERRDLFAAMCKYAVAGNGLPSVKGTLGNGSTKKMIKASGTPGNAPIGDRQYHHFKVTIPQGGVKNFKVEITNDTGKNLHLTLRKGNFAWRTDAQYLLVNDGGNKTLTIDSLEEGTWYIGVYCPDAPKVTCAVDKFAYTGDKSLLNGVPYTISVSWE